MTDFASLLHADRGGPAHTIHLVDKNGFGDWLKKQSPARRAFLKAQRFEGKTPFQLAILGGESHDGFEVVSTVANVSELSPWCLAKLAESLPEGSYRLADVDPGPAMVSCRSPNLLHNRNSLSTKRYTPLFAGAK